jgi:hypothetical protein
MAAKENQLYTLIPLEDFKTVLGVDDREDKLSRFCLVTASLSIEQYCKRRLLQKNILKILNSQFYIFVSTIYQPTSPIIVSDLSILF